MSASSILAEEVADRGLPLHQAHEAVRCIGPLLAAPRSRWAPPRDKFEDLAHGLAIAVRRASYYMGRDAALGAVRAACDRWKRAA